MTLRLGLMARADKRGIGYLTEEFHRHMHPDKVLCVLMNDGWPEDRARFEDADVTFVNSNLSRDLTKRGLDEKKCRTFLEGLDVVFAVETVYEWAFIDWAHDMGVKVIVLGMPEFAAHHNHPAWTHPDLWAWPTPWLLDDLKELGYGTTILPVPCVDRPQTAADPNDEVMRVLHVVGKTAAADRNGSFEFAEAVPSLRHPIHITMVTQDGDVPRRVKPPANVTIEVITGGMESRWDMYENQHLLVLPRKYGGLCLPALEAMSCGVPVLMTVCPPNQIWPGPRVQARKGRELHTPFGRIQQYTVHPIEVAGMIDRLARQRGELTEVMNEAGQFADLNSWATLKSSHYDPLLKSVL